MRTNLRQASQCVRRHRAAWSGGRESKRASTAAELLRVAAKSSARSVTRSLTTARESWGLRLMAGIDTSEACRQIRTVDAREPIHSFVRPCSTGRPSTISPAGTRSDPLASPAHAAADDLTGLAPVLLQAAANEVLADDSATVAERIAAVGGDVTLELCPEAFHVWQMAGPGVPESEEALGSLTRFVRGRWSKPD